MSACRNQPSAANRDASPSELAHILNSKANLEIDAAEVHRTLPSARATFAQLIADEVVETLESPSRDEVKNEIQLLGMTGAFDGLSV